MGAWAVRADRGAEEEPPRRGAGELGFANGWRLPGAEELAEQARLGLRWQRVDLQWRSIERAPGSFDWAETDAFVARAAEAGVEVLATLGFPPPWASGGADDGHHPPEDPAAFARFAARVVERYAPRGVLTYELWNEPNLNSFWKPAPDPAAYARLVRAAYPAMKEVEPAITVLVGALAPAGAYDDPTCGDGETVNVNPVNFLEALYAHGIAGHLDAVSHHPYTDPQVPGTRHRCNAWAQMSATSPSLRSVMAARGDGDKLIWATEYGSDAARMGEEHQAESIALALARWRTYPWAGGLMIFAYYLRTHEGYSLVVDGRRAPAWQALEEGAGQPGG